MAIETSTIYRAREHPVRWSAVIAGWLVAVGIAYLLYVAGLAIGFAAFDPHNAEQTAKGFGIGTAIWVALTWAVSLFLGGMYASWFDGSPDETTGTLHGVAVWGLAVSATGLLIALGVIQPLQNSAALVGGEAEVTATAEEVARYTTAALWAVFVSMLLGLIGGAAGGCVGSSHFDRLYPRRGRD
jgi:hypothetical protein